MKNKSIFEGIIFKTGKADPGNPKIKRLLEATHQRQLALKRQKLFRGIPPNRPPFNQPCGPYGR